MTKDWLTKRNRDLAQEINTTTTYTMNRNLLALIVGTAVVAGGPTGPTRSIAETLAPERARYVSPAEHSPLRFTPLQLADGSRLTLISPNRWSDLTQETMQVLTETHEHLTSIFGAIPPFRSSIRLMEEQDFYDLTGAPSWTNAMFFRGEIIIPLSKSEPIDLDNIHRSVRHEYTHAVLSALSKGSIPGWLDEGLAQWLEGEENPALRQTLKQYLRKHEPIPLDLLQGGFTKLDQHMVPAAYAQSLLAVQAMIKTYGAKTIGTYLSLLRADHDKEHAFTSAFSLTTAEFEQKLHSTLKAWVAPPQTTANPVRTTMTVRKGPLQRTQ